MAKTVEQLMTDNVREELGRLSLEVLMLRAQMAALQQLALVSVPPTTPDPSPQGGD